MGYPDRNRPAGDRGGMLAHVGRLLAVLMLFAALARPMAQSPTPTPTPPPRPAPTPVPGNLLKNPGFEAGKGVKAEGWDMHAGARRTGAEVLLGEWTGQISSIIGGAITQRVAVQPNTQYVLQFWHRTGPNGMHGPMFFYVFGVQEQRYIVADGRRRPQPIDWTLYSIVFNSGSNTTLSIEFAATKDAGPIGELYIDEAALIPRR